MPRKLPSVVLVGRPNVGKSTLFNRMTGARRAIVAPIAGHDARFAGRARSSGEGSRFQLLDTGGLLRRQRRIRCTSWSSSRASARSPAPICLVFLVDGREGLVSGDETIARELRETGLPVVLAVNKTDDKRGAGVGVRSSISSGSSRSSRFRPSTATASADLLDEIVDGLAALGFERARRRRPEIGEATGASRDSATTRASEPSSARPRTMRRSPSSVGRTSASRRSSTDCCAKSACSSATCRARRATRSTRR